MSFESVLIDAAPMANAEELRQSTIIARKTTATFPILAVGLALRAVIVAFVCIHFSANWFYNQGSELAILAESLNGGHGLASPFGGNTGPSAFLAPGYPALVATIFHLFGNYTTASAVSLMALQIIFSLLTILLIIRIAREEFGAQAATIAGWFWAISPAVLGFATLFWESSLSILFLIGIVALALRCSRSPSKGIWIAMGSWCGVAMLVNPSLTIALFVILGWTAFQMRAAARRLPAFGLLACAVIFAPWPIRNVAVMHAFIPFRSNMGYELWQGNRTGSDGFFSPTLHLNASEQEFARYAEIGEVAYMREKGAIAKAAIRDNPVRFLRLTVKRAACFWSGAGKSPGSALIVGHILLTTLLMVVGLVILLKERPSLAILFLLPMIVFPLPYYLTHPDFRFRMVLDPLATIMSTYALTALAAKLKRAHSPRSNVGTYNDVSARGV